MSYDGIEKRRYPRINANLIISYRPLTGKDRIDTSQTKNISLGGILFQAKKEFAQGTNLLLEIKFPSENTPVIFIGKVLGSRQVIEGLCYDTRIQFLSVNESQKKAINSLENYLKEKKGEE